MWLRGRVQCPGALYLFLSAVVVGPVHALVFPLVGRLSSTSQHLPPQASLAGFAVALYKAPRAPSPLAGALGCLEFTVQNSHMCGFQGPTPTPRCN